MSLNSKFVKQLKSSKKSNLCTLYVKSDWNDVYGVLPLHLASLANTVTTVDMNLPAEMRGKELSLEDIEKYFTGMSTYKVKKI